MAVRVPAPGTGRRVLFFLPLLDLITRSPAAMAEAEEWLAAMSKMSDGATAEATQSETVLNDDELSRTQKAV